MSAAKRNPENIARITEMARNQSAETRAKIAAAHRGMKASDETRAKISAAKKGGPGWSGERSAETRAKMSASAKVRCARNDRQRDETGKFT